MVAKYPDLTLWEYCEYWGNTYNHWVSTSTMCRALQRLNLTRKKKVVEIEPLIQSVGASVLYQSPYSPDFNPIEHWWSQLKAFLRSFSPTNAKMLDGLIAIALNARQSYSFNKTGLPTVVTVPHPPEICCMNYGVSSFKNYGNNKSLSK
jgi:DDE superfamily endonuclease